METGKESGIRRMPMLSIGMQLGVWSAILLGTLFYMVWNTSGLHTKLETTTDAYVSDVTYQLTKNIEAQFRINLSMLEQLADSAGRLPGQSAVEDFLRRKAGIGGFDQLIVVGRDGKTVPPQVPISDLHRFSGVEKAFRGESSVVYLEGQSLLLSVPVYENGQVTSVLAAIRGKENIQRLIRPDSFGEQGLTCIVDSQGQVVISPTDVKAFTQLADILNTGEKNKTADDIRQMEADFADMNSGVFHFTAVNGSRLVMSYHAIGINDWILLTLVPADLISGETATYTVRSFLIVAGIIGVFALFFLILFQFFVRYRRWLEEAAFTDPVTGGMNNAAFQVRCSELITGAPPNTYTIIMLDVKGFKYINAEYGVAAGNDTLRYINTALVKALGKNEAAARSETDHFFLCLDAGEKAETAARLRKILNGVNRFLRTAGIQYQLMFLQGACVADDPQINIRLIQDRARIACRLQTGTEECLFYSQELDRTIKKEQALNARFESALQNHEFQVYLQPKIRLSDGKIGGAEALVRWVRPMEGVISPGEFIPVFEKSGNICRLDLYVFEEVCRLLARWIAEGKPVFPVSVNMSRAHFKKVSFFDSFVAIKKQYAIPDGILELELTEATFFDEEHRRLLGAVLGQMHQNGLLCSLDDFGTGYSALGLLREIEVDGIKLDRQFFEDIQSPRSKSVIASFVELARRLGIHVVAEGIETRDQLEFLREIQCEMVQGYIFSKPLSIPEFETWSKTMPD